MGLPNTETQIFTFFIFLFFLLSPLVVTFPILPEIPNLPDINPPQKPNSQQPQPEIPLLPGEFPQSEKQQFLNAHNKVRANAGEPLFVWDETLASYARTWANKRILDCSMIHSLGPYGENIFWGGRDHWTPKDAVKSWVKEHKFYNRKTNACLPGKLCGHYTQIVWRDSIKVGCARVKCLNGGIFMICSYDPPGNYVNENPFLPNNDIYNKKS
ncbi:hypothetical protein CRYUN_Cryun23aG0127500 [Craigia yunnanensis]